MLILCYFEVEVILKSLRLPLSPPSPLMEGDDFGERGQKRKDMEEDQEGPSEKRPRVGLSLEQTQEISERRRQSQILNGILEEYDLTRWGGDPPETWLLIAVERNLIDLIKRVAKQAPLMLKDFMSTPSGEMLYIPLEMAIESENYKMAFLLLGLESPLEGELETADKSSGYFAEGDKYYDNANALSLAIQKKHVMLVKELLRRGANPNRLYGTNLDYATALELASRDYNNGRILSSLFDAGANVDVAAWHATYTAALNDFSFVDFHGNPMVGDLNRVPPHMESDQWENLINQRLEHYLLLEDTPPVVDTVQLMYQDQENWRLHSNGNNNNNAPINETQVDQQVLWNDATGLHPMDFESRQ